MKYTVASTGRKEHKSEVFEALASSLAKENHLLAVRTLDGCKHAGSDRGHELRDIKLFIFLVDMRVQCIQWNLYMYRSW